MPPPYYRVREALSKMVPYPVLTAEVTDDDSDKTFTVTALKDWIVKLIHVKLVTSADVGDRQIAVIFTTAADVEIMRVIAGAVVAASTTRYITFGMGLANMAAFVDTDQITQHLPEVQLPAGYKIRVYDSAAVAAAADDMHVQMLVDQYVTP